MSEAGNSIPCPQCGSTAGYVLDSRPRGKARMRRRLCNGCGFRFSTVERVKEADIAAAAWFRGTKASLVALRASIDKAIDGLGEGPPEQS